jgi:hypothetical protein
MVESLLTAQEPMDEVAEDQYSGVMPLEWSGVMNALSRSPEVYLSVSTGWVLTCSSVHLKHF